MSARISTPVAAAIGLAASVLTALAALPARAATIDVVNHSFEDVAGEPGFNEFTFGPPPGWTLYENGAPDFTSDGDGPDYFVGTLAPQPDPDAAPAYSFFPAGAPHGTRVAIAFSYAGTGDDGTYGLEQTLAATLQPSTTYTLSVAVGNITSGTDVAGTVYDLSGFPGYRIELLAGGVTLGLDDGTSAGPIVEGTFATRTVSFTTGAAPAQAGELLGIRLVNLNSTAAIPAGADIEVDFDDVQLTATPVPEPAGALALFTPLAIAFARPRRHANGFARQVIFTNIRKLKINICGTVFP